MANNLTALDMLRKQAESRPTTEDLAKIRAEARVYLNKTLLASMHYLAEFAKQLNSIRPSTEGPYDFLYLRQASRMVLSNAFADYRARKIEGEDVCDYVYLKYQAQYAQPVTMNVAGPDLDHCRRLLSLGSVPFEFIPAKKDDFGRPVSGAFTISGPISCELYLRADYDAPAVLIELLNVGNIGKGHCRLEPKAFDKSVTDEIAKYALATKNEFAKLVTA